MINEEDKQKITDDVQESFIERMNNTISEKLSFCRKKGLSEDEANNTITQVVKNLPNHLLPIKVVPQGDAVSDYNWIDFSK